LAFLDTKRDRLAVRLMVSPEDGVGALKRRLEDRTRLIEQYAASVSARIVEFNQELAKKMAIALNESRGIILKAEEELENVGVPRVYNPEHAESAVQIERIMRHLAGYVTDESSHDGGPSEMTTVRSFIVHGHGDKSLYELKNCLQNTLKLEEPVMLQETPGLGKTIIEKF
jgi:predicted nucleotide-binding protein